jgi:hypothetical protein
MSNGRCFFYDLAQWFTNTHSGIILTLIIVWIYTINVLHMKASDLCKIQVIIQ